MSTITITFGEQAENSRGMQKIGKIEEKGYNKLDLEAAKVLFEKSGYKCRLADLTEFVEVETA
jgi:hypothetical protein